MEHVLDNPAWHALTSGNKHLSHGNERVKYFDKEVSPFVGMKENSAEEFYLLYETIPHDGPICYVTPIEGSVLGRWDTVGTIKGIQMVCENPVGGFDTTFEPVILTVEHVPQMLELTKLTNPGPFAERTIDFGHYRGIFDGDKLVSMAGQRMHIYNYAEISAVCTHPDYLGRGYARALLLNQTQRIKSAGETPILHVRYDNERAIKVYESLGFITRTEMYFYILQKVKKVVF